MIALFPASLFRASGSFAPGTQTPRPSLPATTITTTSTPPARSSLRRQNPSSISDPACSSGITVSKTQPSSPARYHRCDPAQSNCRRPCHLRVTTRACQLAPSPAPVAPNLPPAAIPSPSPGCRDATAPSRPTPLAPALLLSFSSSSRPRHFPRPHIPPASLVPLAARTLSWPVPHLSRSFRSRAALQHDRQQR